MLSNQEFRDKIKKVHPEYVQITPKGNEKWKESRVFWTCIYRESLDKDILECCDKFSAPSALSPEHNMDVDEHGEIKKGHWHFIAKYNSKKNPYQFYCDLVSAFGEKCFSTVEIVGDIGKATRYLAHIDEEDSKKYHYPIEDIKSFGGYELKKYLFENVGDTMDNVGKIKAIIKDKNFLFFDELADYVEEVDPLLYAGLVKDREVKAFVRDYLRGREHSLWYAGEVEKGYTKIHMDNGTDKVIFNREFKAASVL